MSNNFGGGRKKPPKVVAMDWHVSRSCVTKILQQYLHYALVWRPGMEPPPLREIEIEEASQARKEA